MIGDTVSVSASYRVTEDKLYLGGLTGSPARMRGLIAVDFEGDVVASLERALQKAMPSPVNRLVNFTLVSCDRSALYAGFSEDANGCRLLYFEGSDPWRSQEACVASGCYSQELHNRFTEMDTRAGGDTEISERVKLLHNIYLTLTSEKPNVRELAGNLIERYEHAFGTKLPLKNDE